MSTSQDNKPVFVVIYEGQQSQTVTLTSPKEIPVGTHNKNLQQDLHLYLENYLKRHIVISRVHVEDIQKTLSQWGRNCFDALFGSSPAQDWYYKAQQEKLTNLQLTIVSKDPTVLSWPWEALKNQKNEFIAQQQPITRQLPNIADSCHFVDKFSSNRLNILYIIARPTDTADVEYQTLARPLIDFINNGGWSVHVDVLRPPTFEKLQQVLEEKFYHIIHFDGHGVYSSESGGVLAFEKDNPDYIEHPDYSSDHIKATMLGNLLRKHNMPLVVLNACQSATVDEQAKDPFTSVAANLLQAGIPNVVAMSYSLYISGAKVFVPAFYQQLFENGDVAKAMLTARQAMYNNKMRDTFTGQTEFHDWIVPVLYQQTTKNTLPKLKPNSMQNCYSQQKKLEVGNWGLIGRDQNILQLERAIREKPASILIHGMAGEGKTTLVKGFLQWLENTNGLSKDPFWFSFQDIRSAEYVINTLTDKLFGSQTLTLPTEQKIVLITQELTNSPHFIVWDNFESAYGIPNTEISALLSEADRTLLKQLLRDLYGGKTKILITSRSPENWLAPRECQRIPLYGLRGAELWQYCNSVVKDLGLSFDRGNKTYKKLMDKLNGNPLAIRAILLRLKEKPATELLTELEENFNGLVGDDATRRIQAALSVFEKGLNQDFTSVLRLLGLHEQYVDAGYLKDMLGATGNSNPKIDECFTTLENAGLCHAVGGLVYRLHPALQSCLTRNHPASDDDKQVFVNMMNKLVAIYIDKELHEQLHGFTLFGANFYCALNLSQKITLPDAVLTLTDTLALYALNTRNFTEATRLYTRCFKTAKEYNNKQAEASAYHNLGLVAQEQRDVTVAVDWYNKALQISQKLGNKYDTAQTYHQLGLVAQEQRDFTVAKKWYYKSLQISKKLDDESGIAQTYHNLGIVAQEQQKFDKAKEWYNKSLSITLKLGDEYSMAKTYQTLGNTEFERGDLDIAKDWYYKSLQINQKLGDEYSVAQIYHNLGLVAYEQRDFTTAEEWYNKALQIDQRLNDRHSLAQTYHSLGNVAYEQKDLTTAKEWYNKSLQISREVNDEQGTAKTCHQLGLVAQEQRDFTVAKKWYNKSLQISKKLDDEHGVAQTAHQLGIVMQAQQKFDKAKEWYNISLSITLKLSDEQGTASSYHQLGCVAYEQRDFAVAKKLYNKSLRIFARIGDQYNFDIVNQSLTELERASTI
ncbi:MAG: tetratricopeptide repeat protein [Nitrososphaerota archaeon]|nr:tetratricopeptide repeat protein [Nitrososphaerota archaeon]